MKIQSIMEQRDKFPKVLIIGQNFNTKSGAGITLKNLFKGWPKEKIAVASNSVSEDCASCSLHYVFGSKENIKPRIFNGFRNIQKSKIVSSEETEISKNVDHNKEKKMLESRTKKRIKTIIKKILLFLGIFLFFEKLKISNKFEHFIEKFKPDIIYTQTESLKVINLMIKLKKNYDLPVVTHVMDDWISSINRKGIMSWFWKRTIKLRFEKLIDISKSCFSVSEYMSEEYQKRYSKEFIPFRNPIDLDIWSRFTKYNWDISKIVKLMYAGNIGSAKTIVFDDIIKAVNKLNKRKYNIEFHLYVPLDKKDRINKRGSNIFIHGFVDYDEMPELVSTFDILMIPLDFNKASVKYAKYSLSTKLSEFMISAVPIIIYAPVETAIFKFATENKLAYCVGNKGVKNIYSAIKDLIDNKLLRQKLGKKAHEIAYKNCSAHVVRKRFREQLLNVIN